MSTFSRLIDKILTSKYNKPFPVTLLPSTIGYYLGIKQGQRQEQLVREIREAAEGDLEAVRAESARVRSHGRYYSNRLETYGITLLDRQK